MNMPIDISALKKAEPSDRQDSLVHFPPPDRRPQHLARLPGGVKRRLTGGGSFTSPRSAF